MRFVKTQLPCPCGKSSDAFALNEDNSGKCFSCGDFFPNKDKNNIVEEPDILDNVNVTYEYTNLRGISKRTREFYGVQTKLINNVPVSTAYPWGDNSLKIRRLGVPKTEAFSSSGPIGSHNLFGKERFSPGSKPFVLITEGEEDAMAAYEMLFGRGAVVSVKNAATAFADIKNEREYLNSFKKIILCLDNDSKGQTPQKQILGAGFFDYEKLYCIQMPLGFKDANDYIEQNKADEFIKIFDAAKRWTPDSIINSFDEIKAALSRKDNSLIGTYPFTDLQDSLKGLHKGEIILIKGLEGIGKTEICRAFSHHLLKTTKLNQALIFLEESEDVTIKGVATYELEKPCNLDESGVSDEDILNGYKKALGDDESRLYIHTHFSSEDDNEIIDNIRFLVTVAGCSVVYLDNLTMLITGREGEDERLRIDRLIKRLRDLVNELHFCLILIAHVNDNNQTRGSRLPDKLCNTVVIMFRNPKANTTQERNVLSIEIEKVRTQGARTGKAGGAYFDPVTYKLRDMLTIKNQLPEIEE